MVKIMQIKKKLVRINYIIIITKNCIIKINKLIKTVINFKKYLIRLKEIYYAWKSEKKYIIVIINL